ncbi:unnamed protein product [marine sediment metagenome]|uniref:DUF1353 domain-containing protein n=1 Tax=marine sediment metagenome TaxID=412755 RepID=X1C270_9ZZZZ
MVLLEGEEFLRDWKEVTEDSDGCSSWLAKYIARWFFWLIRNARNYKCICLQHDFDYTYGWKYGVSKEQADNDLKDGIKASNHPVAAKIMYWFVVKFGESHYRYE